MFSPQDVLHVHNCTNCVHQGSKAQQPITHPFSGFTPKELHKIVLEKQKRAKQFAKQQQQARCFRKPGIVSLQYTGVLTSIKAIRALLSNAVVLASCFNTSKSEVTVTHLSSFSMFITIHAHHILPGSG